MDKKWHTTLWWTSFLSNVSFGVLETLLLPSTRAPPAKNVKYYLNASYYKYILEV